VYEDCQGGGRVRDSPPQRKIRGIQYELKRVPVESLSEWRRIVRVSPSLSLAFTSAPCFMSATLRIQHQRHVWDESRSIFGG
jgi:hypothetical protein